VRSLVLIIQLRGSEPIILRRWLLTPWALFPLAKSYQSEIYHKVCIKSWFATGVWRFHGQEARSIILLRAFYNDMFHGILSYTCKWIYERNHIKYGQKPPAGLIQPVFSGYNGHWSMFIWRALRMRSKEAVISHIQVLLAASNASAYRIVGDVTSFRHFAEWFWRRKLGILTLTCPWFESDFLQNYKSDLNEIWFQMLPRVWLIWST
jgi:hypothetical protein